jgi:exopolysaccharide biosynthesis polyprenyl glycosylphosphotransferase
MTSLHVATSPVDWSAPIDAPARVTPSTSFTRVVPRSTPTLERRRTWERAYRTRLRASDTAVVLIATSGASFLQLTTVAPGALAEDPWILGRIPLGTAAVWILLLSIFQTRESRTTGSGSSEYKRVAHATGLAFGLVAMCFVVFQWPGLRVQIVLALPFGLAALLATRRGWRKWLVAQRRDGRFVSRALVVGRPTDVHHVIATLQRDDQLGFEVVGTALEGDAAAELVVHSRRYPAVATPHTVAAVARELGADTIVVASHVQDPDYIRRLGWELEGTAADLVLSSRLTDVAGPRISLRQVVGLPLIHVRIPSFDGSRHAYKRALDILVAGAALIPIAALTPVLALVIALDSPGGVFFRQRRVGQNGREFDILKFRTMRATAEIERTDLLAGNEGAGPLFKMRNDPRVTRVGAILRKYSLDELPQFWNVLRGDMSVVGPRPPLPAEVGGYDGPVFRRLYIKPGITGLWQVSGRSDLSWEESVRLDLHYVENWSVMTDLMIIVRTAKVMFRGTGAY